MPADRILEKRIAELEADNRRLRRLLDQRDCNEELRHRFRNTLLTLRTVIRRSSETQRDLASYVQHVEDRLGAVVRAQSAADAQGSVELYSLVADELLHYGLREGRKVTLSGPTFRFRPRAGQTFALALHELTINSVEHGVLGGDVGRVEIAWTVSESPVGETLMFRWQEIHDQTLRAAEFRTHQGFGTEVLTRTMPYELGSKNSFETDNDSFTWTFAIPVTERIGYPELT